MFKIKSLVFVKFPGKQCRYAGKYSLSNSDERIYTASKWRNVIIFFLANMIAKS